MQTFPGWRSIRSTLYVLRDDITVGRHYTPTQAGIGDFRSPAVIVSAFWGRRIHSPQLLCTQALSAPSAGALDATSKQLTICIV